MCSSASLFVTVHDTQPETRSTSTKTEMVGCLSPCLVSVRNKKSSCTCGSLGSASPRRRRGSSVPRGAIQMGHQLRNGNCNGSCCATSSSHLWDLLVLASLARHGVRLEFGLVFPEVLSSSQQGFSFCCRDQRHFQRRNLFVQRGFRHITEWVNCQEELSASRRPPVRMHAPFLENSTSQPIAVKSLTATMGR